MINSQGTTKFGPQETHKPVDHVLFIHYRGSDGCFYLIESAGF